MVDSACLFPKLAIPTESVLLNPPQEIMKIVYSGLCATFICLLFVSGAVAKKATLYGVNDPKSALYTYKGEAFAAVPLPSNIQAKTAQLQGQLSQCLGPQFSASPKGNLHITLQLIGPVSKANDVKRIHQALRVAANKNKFWNLAKHTPKLKIKLHDDGLVSLRLPRSDSLTRLARSIRGSLDKSRISHSKRWDYPDNAHITIGMVAPSGATNGQRYTPAAIAKLRGHFQQCMSSKQVNLGVMRARKFVVDKFALSKSNRPAKKRQYATLGTYSLR